MTRPPFNRDSGIRIVKRSLLFLVSCFFAVTLSGCLIAPFFEPVRNAGLTEEARRGLIVARVNLFHQLVAQNKIEDALTITTDAAREDVRAALDDLADGFTVTGAEIKKRLDAEGVSSSKVTVELQRYKVGRNTLETIALTETWTFSHSDGWLLAGLVRAPKNQK